MDIVREVGDADKRIRPHIRETILEHSTAFSTLGGGEVFFKLENLQHTGSFKARGALNKILSLPESECARGVVTASTGNHGAAVAFASRTVGARSIVFVPENASPTKLSIIKRLGADVHTYGTDCGESEIHARGYAKEHGLIYVPPYNDPKVVGGQGTIAVELTRQLERIDAIFVSLGGGGLISGIAGYLRSVLPDVEVFGCSPENSQVMIQSVRAGRILDLPSLPTLSDGTAGGVEADAITFELVRDLVDEFATVTEEQIKDTLRTFIDTHHLLIEGSAAVAIAAYLQRKEMFIGKNVVIVVCGANISLDMLKQVLAS